MAQLQAAHAAKEKRGQEDAAARAIQRRGRVVAAKRNVRKKHDRQHAQLSRPEHRDRSPRAGPVIPAKVKAAAALTPTRDQQLDRGL